MVKFPVLAFCAALALPGAGVAQNQAPDLSHVVQFELLTGWRQPSGNHMSAVRVTLAEGWNTYWRVSGGTGIPPRIDFAGSGNFHSAEIHWPRPSVLDYHGDTVIGYVEELILPFEVTPGTSGQDVELEAVLDLGVCSDMCVPIQVSFTELLASAHINRSLDISGALDTVPVDPLSGGLRSISCTLSPLKNGFQITARLELPHGGTGREMAMFELEDPNVWIDIPATHREGNVLVAEAKAVNYGGGVFELDPADLRVTVLGPTVSMDIRGCPAF